jgi:hypothetical protein
MLDTATHKRFIERHNSVVDDAKQDIITAALRTVAPRRVLSDPGHANELFMAVVLAKSRAAFIRVAAIGAEFAGVKHA